MRAGWWMAVAAALLTGCMVRSDRDGRWLPDGRWGRCVWVNRWEYRTAEDIRRVMGHCAEAGFTTVLFQVRGGGTAHYRSVQEPWALRYGFKDPGYDPLAVALSAARQHGLKLHAWVNVMPGWSGAKPPTDRRQLFVSRPDWFMRTVDGKVAREGNYAWLDPRKPEVRAYLATLVRELAESYDIDGVHLDYIRFPHVKFARAAPASESLVSKRDAVTKLVQEIRQQLRRAARPRPALLSASVYGDLQVARYQVLQDWPRWARYRTVDAVFPMIYRVEDRVLRQRVRDCVRMAGVTPVICGVGSRWHKEPKQTLRQVRTAMAAGARNVSIYGYTQVREARWRQALAGGR